MPERQKQDEWVRHAEWVALKKRVEALESRVTELEKELREAQEVEATESYVG